MCFGFWRALLGVSESGNFPVAIKTVAEWFPKRERAVALISLAASLHQGWSANMYTTVSDTFPKRVVSSIIGFGGSAGALGGAFVSIFAGSILEFYKKAGHIETGYTVMFTIASGAYLLAWIIMYAFAPINKIAVID